MGVHRPHALPLRCSGELAYVTFVNSYAPYVGPKYREHILMDLNVEIKSDIIVVGDFNIPLTSMDKSSKQKISK